MEQGLILKKTSRFKSDVFRLATGSGLVQVISLLTAPVLTRLYAPDAFGVAALFAAVTGIVGTLACMRYQMAIVLPDNDGEAANLLGVSLLFPFLMAFLVVVFMGYVGPFFPGWADGSALVPYFWLIPLMVLVHGIFTALNYWNTRTAHFTRLSIARVFSKVIATSAGLGAGVAGHATGGALIAANVGGQAVSTVVLGGQIWRDNGKFIRSSLSLKKMWAGLKKYRNFPIYSSWAILLNAISWQLPVLMLGGLFSTTTAGFYALGFRIFQMPMALVGSAISQVFHQRAAKEYSEGTLAPLVAQVFRRLLGVALFPMLMLGITGRDVFIVIFGRQWAEAGLYAQIMSGWALIWFVSSPMSVLFGVMGQQVQELRIQALIFFTRLAAILAGAFLNSALLAIVLFSAVGAVVYAYLVFLIFRYAGVPVRPIFNGIKRLTFQASPYLAGAVAGTYLLNSSVLVVGLAAVLTGIYFWTNWSELMTEI
jgi:lipopolysaccharide exporter